MRAYVTVLSTDSYTDGVLVLAKSLEKVKSRYNLYVVISEEINEENKRKLKESRIEIIDSFKAIKLPNSIKNRNDKRGYSNWNYTLEKLHIFDLDNFEKLVYLDSDMLITKNIDELFEYEHMAAVVASKLLKGNENWESLNSGIMVIVPERGLKEKILSKLDKVSEKKNIVGDQDLLQEYYHDWKEKKELELDQKYNLFFPSLEYYCNEHGYNCDFNNPNDRTVAVMHFVGLEKVWMQSTVRKLKTLARLIINGDKNTLKVYIKYNIILNSIR